MGFVVACFFTSFVCILGAGVISIVSRERGTLLWILMMVGALATLFEGPILLQVASRVVGFEISD